MKPTSFLVSIAVVLALAVAGGPAGATTTWAPADARVNDPATQFDGAQKNIYEPTVAIDPTDPGTMVAFAIDLSAQNVNPDMWSTIRGFRSTDGGASWADTGPVRYDPTGALWDSGDPVAVFDPDGTAYLASLADPTVGDGEGGIWVHRSDDGGASWNAPVLARADTRDETADVCTSTDKEWLSVDPASHRLFLTWTDLTYQCSSLNDPFGLDVVARVQDMGVFLATSDDRGATWTAPRRLWTGYALGAIPKVEPDGTLHVTFWSATEVSDALCPTAIGLLLAKAGGRAFASMVVATSEDGGGTWRYHRRGMCGAEPELLKSGRFVGGNILPTIWVDRSEPRTYVAWPAYSLVTQRFAIKVMTTTDGGTTWSEPVEVRHPDGSHALEPVIHAEDGVARLVYLTSTEDARGDAYVVESTDGGSTWSAPVTLSSASADYSQDADVGDYIGLDLAGDRIAAIWTDARNTMPTEIRARMGSL